MIPYLFDFYTQLKNSGIIFCFSGPTTQDIVESIGETLRRKMEIEDAGLTASQKVFSIFVEQMQNIINYSAEKSSREEPPIVEELRYGVLVVGRDENGFFVLCGNYIGRDQARLITDKLNEIKDLDKTQLKALYKERRRSDPPKESRGSGLGFIDMARKASRPLEFAITPLDPSYCFFSLKAVI